MPPIRVVVFDIDDTLYLERDYAYSGFRAVDRWLAERFGREGFFEQSRAAFENGLRGRIFDHVLAAWGISGIPALVSELVTIYRTHDPAITLLPDAARCLNALKGTTRLAAISDGPLESQQAKAKRLGLYDCMDRVILTASLGPSFQKPHPRAFQEIETALDAKGKECVYLGDNPAKDFQAPRQLGWRTVRVRRYGGMHEVCPCSLPVDLVVRDLEMIPDWLDSA